MAGVETLRHGLGAPLATESVDIGEWDEIAREYGRTYSTTPPRVLLHDLVTDLLVARAHLDGLSDDRARRDVQRAVALLSAFLAQTWGNLGNSRAGRRWWRIARRAADASGDTEARVWVRGREIIRGLYEHRPLEAVLDLADEAAALSHRPGVGTGDVHTGRAQALAVLGRAAEAERAMAAAYATADRLPARVTEDAASMYGWPEYRLRYTESFVYTYLGNGGRAAAAQEQALSLYPAPMFRARAQVRLYQAMRLVQDGDPTAGVRTRTRC
jgi:hypothetical protein